MKTISTMTLAALGLTALASACTMEAVEIADEDVGTDTEALVCTNHKAVHSVMAAMASAAANELGRWKPQAAGKEGDLTWNWNTGKLELTSTGNARCAAWPVGAPKNCKWLKASLEYQNSDMKDVVVGGQQLDTDLLRQRLEVAWKRQETCMQQPDNGQQDNCPVEAHDLKFVSASNPSNSCATVVKLDAFKAASTTPVVNLFSKTLSKPKQLANMLIWAGWLGDEPNPWIAFDAVGDTVSIDPLPGMSDGVPNAQSGGAYLVSYNHQVLVNGIPTPKWGVVESISGVVLTGLPCKADPEFCTVPAGTACPVNAVKYLYKRPLTNTKFDCR